MGGTWFPADNLRRVVFPAFLAALILLFFTNVGLASDIPEREHDAARERMVSMQLEARGVRNQDVLRVMRKVRRHLFVPENLRGVAYEDHALPIGEGQTISQPYVVAMMTAAIEPKPDMKVLEIGTGSGYQAAILGELCQSVYTIEIVESLGKKAAGQLARLYKNVHVRIGDGYSGWPEEAPFDAIIVTCAPTKVPQPLADQLKEGGRMVIPVGETGVQELVVLTKKNGRLREQVILPVRFVPMVDSQGKKY